MRKTKGLPFNEEADKIIIKYVRKWRRNPNPYAKISREKIPQYTAKQIRQRWLNKINPRLCGESLDETKKTFIVQWVETNQKSPTDKIHWKDLIPVMKDQFGKLYSENKLKNYYFSRKRRLNKQIEFGPGPSETQTDDTAPSSVSSIVDIAVTISIQPPDFIELKPDPPQFKEPKMDPIF